MVHTGLPAGIFIADATPARRRPRRETGRAPLPIGMEFTGLSMNELAQALNVRTPSLYSHVAGINDVKRLLVLHGMEELDDGAARATIGKAGPDACAPRTRGMARSHKPAEGDMRCGFAELSVEGRRGHPCHCADCAALSMRFLA